jgi:uncharacterized membrane protein
MNITSAAPTAVYIHREDRIATGVRPKNGRQLAQERERRHRLAFATINRDRNLTGATRAARIVFAAALALGRLHNDFFLLCHDCCLLHDTTV